MQVPILYPLSDRQLWQLARVLVPQNFAKGEPVFRQGDAADKFYICQRGAFTCFLSERAGARAKLCADHPSPAACPAHGCTVGSPEWAVA